ncbi:DUF1653 domain-containing protein [Alicyclobacillus tolerans]|uniref:DUF1653 domain-containing protein n=1 Tax=Alicyclobacillus tolerans TaxID=90970 RepID=UPI003B780075
MPLNFFNIIPTEVGWGKVTTNWKNIKNGKKYTMLHEEVRHSETLEDLVVYRAPDGSVWARPKELFFQKFVPANDVEDSTLNSTCKKELVDELHAETEKSFWQEKEIERLKEEIRELKRSEEEIWQLEKEI